jgi:transcriptional regulator with XRE-family HTH domain
MPPRRNEPEPIEMTGSELRDIRLRLGLTQVKFALRLGLHEITVSEYERDKAPIPVKIARLARTLK